MRRNERPSVTKILEKIQLKVVVLPMKKSIFWLEEVQQLPGEYLFIALEQLLIDQSWPVFRSPPSKAFSNF